MVALTITGCAYQKHTRIPTRSNEPTLSETVPPPHVTSCRKYADNMAGRQLDQARESISSNFQGGDGGVLDEFARMDAEHYYEQLYKSCLGGQRDNRKHQFGQ
jgi:hypothetical protein